MLKMNILNLLVFAGVVISAAADETAPLAGPHGGINATADQVGQVQEKSAARELQEGAYFQPESGVRARLRPSRASNNSVVLGFLASVAALLLLWCYQNSQPKRKSEDPPKPANDGDLPAPSEPANVRALRVL